MSVFSAFFMPFSRTRTYRSPVLKGPVRVMPRASRSRVAYGLAKRALDEQRAGDVEDGEAQLVVVGRAAGNVEGRRDGPEGRLQRGEIL